MAYCRNRLQAIESKRYYPGMDTKNALESVRSRLAQRKEEIDALQARSQYLAIDIKDLQTAEQVLLGLLGMTADKDEVKERGSIKSLILQCFKSGEELTVKQVMAKLGALGDYKYGSVVSDMYRMRQKGILEQNQVGMYRIPTNGEGAQQGSLNIAGISTANSESRHKEEGER